MKNMESIEDTENKIVYKECKLPLVPEKKAEFEKCIETLNAHKSNVPHVARAIATIDREGYYAFYEGKEYKNTEDFVSGVYGFDRTYIFRMKRYGTWLIKADIPDGKEPSETSVREILQNGFSDEDRSTIYHDAKAICYQRLNSQKSPENSESASQDSQAETILPEKYSEIVPEAKDIRKSLTHFREGSGRIYFPALENKSYPAATPFADILNDPDNKFTGISMIFSCFRIYKKAKKMTAVDAETEQAVRNHVARLIEYAQREMEELLKTSGETHGKQQ